MPLLFLHVSDLLEELSAVKTRDPPYLPKDAEARSHEIIRSFFRERRRLFTDENAEALLSTLLPERRTDRVYGLKEKSLEKIIGRALCLSNGRWNDLRRYQQPGAGDIGDCLERVQRQADVASPARGDEVSVGEVDRILTKIAAKNRFSSPDVQREKLDMNSQDPVLQLSGIYTRLKAKEAKWLTRLILKNYSPVIIPEYVVYRSYHGMLPVLLKVQSTFPAALALLREWKNVRVHAGNKFSIMPRIGTKVGRQPFLKARSIKNCVDLARNRCMSVQKKYDGEYCQIHIDMSRPPAQRIQIFSKSGKDSTTDRAKVHESISRCLKLTENDCTIKQQCILEGELLVYNDQRHAISAFHKIRKHVTRSGVSLGTEQDSPAHDHEHLMVVFFDILMLDDMQVLGMAQNKRWSLLKQVITCISGRAELAETHLISFSKPLAAKKLRDLLTSSIVNKSEGLVMKPANEPYFSFDDSAFGTCCIKIKKEYFGSFGDVGDFAVIGASYEAVRAKEYGLPMLKWTHFWVACLENKDAVERWDESPRFVVVAIVSPNIEIVNTLIKFGNLNPKPADHDPSFSIRIEAGVSKGRNMSTIFGNPPIFDIRCFAFDKEANTGFWGPRFPLVSKVHFDRTYLSAISFAELQHIAEESQQPTVDDDGQEDRRWVERLKNSDPRRIPVDACTPSPFGRSVMNDRLPGITTTVSELIPTTRAPTTESNQYWKQTMEIECDASPLEPYEGLKAPRFRRIDSSLSANHIAVNLYPTMTHSGQSTASISAGKKSPESLCLRKAARALRDITNTHITTDKSPDTCPEAPKKRARIFDLNHEPDRLNHTPFAAGRHELSKLKTRHIYTDPLDCAKSLDRGNQSKGDFKEATTAMKRSSMDTIEGGGASAVELATPRLQTSCKLLPVGCALAGCHFCLAPCIAQFPWITENLMGHHGAAFTVEFETWLDLTCFDGTAHQKLRRILLVDTNRKSETVKLIKEMEELKMTMQSGVIGGDKREFLIEVYDWRLLECLTKRERQEALVYGNPWRSFWVGAF